MNERIVTGQILSIDYEAGTLSAPAFTTVEVETVEGMVERLEAVGGLAKYVRFLHVDESVTFLVLNDQISAVA